MTEPDIRSMSIVVPTLDDEDLADTLLKRAVLQWGAIDPGRLRASAPQVDLGPDGSLLFRITLTLEDERATQCPLCDGIGVL